jgi:hypothetical protein
VALRADCTLPIPLLLFFCTLALARSGWAELHVSDWRQ